jgi:predicted RNase H-like HicB family nuclease
LLIGSQSGWSSCLTREGPAFWNSALDLSAGTLAKGLKRMAYYIALIHKDRDGCCGVSFPDAPGMVAAGDTIDEAMRNAAEVLQFALEDWSEITGEEFPRPHSIDELRSDTQFAELAGNAVIAAVPLQASAEAVA